MRIHSCQMAYFFSSPLKPFKKKGPHSFRHTNLLCSLKDFYCSHNLLWPSCILKGPAKSPCDDQATGTHMGSKFFLYEYIFLHQLSFHEIILKFSYNMYILIRITLELELECSFRNNWNPWPVTVAFVSMPLSTYILYFPVFVIRIWAFCLPQKNIFFQCYYYSPG